MSLAVTYNICLCAFKWSLCKARFALHPLGRESLMPQCPHQLVLHVCCQVISWQPFHHLAFNIETVSPTSLGCSISNVLKSCFKTLQLPLIFRFVFDLMLEANDVDVDADVEVVVVEVEVSCWCWSWCLRSQSQQATKKTLWPMLVNVLPDPRNFTPL